VSMEGEMQTELDNAFAFAKQSPFPEEHSLLEHVYAP
jgi:TPP-dependent pyruvate/acetoin dehydrogenase alpha subunit